MDRSRLGGSLLLRVDGVRGVTLGAAKADCPPPPQKQHCRSEGARCSRPASGGGAAVLAQQAAQPGCQDRRAGIAGRWPKVEAAVGPSPVVVLDVLLQDAPEVAGVHDQKPVQRLAASGSDPASSRARATAGQAGKVISLKATGQVVERSGRALLHWVNPPEVRPLFYASPVTAPADVDSFCEIWERRRAGSGIGPGALGVAVEPLARELADAEAGIRGTEQFRTVYEPLGAQFASVSIENLVTPQWWVDAEHVEELVSDVPGEDDLDGVFDFCFSPGSIGLPLILGMNGAVVTSRKRGLGMISPLRVAAVTPHKITFEFDALPRPNWLWLSIVPDDGSVLILNGVHHVAALQRAGHRRAFALVREGPLQGVLNFQEPGLFKPERLICPRPPLVRDFHDPGIADDVRVRTVEQFMRFGVQNPPEIGFVPQTGT